MSIREKVIETSKSPIHYRNSNKQHTKHTQSQIYVTEEHKRVQFLKTGRLLCDTHPIIFSPLPQLRKLLVPKSPPWLSTGKKENKKKQNI